MPRRSKPSRDPRLIACLRAKGWTLQRIATRLGVSRQRVHQLVTGRRPLAAKSSCCKCGTEVNRHRGRVLCLECLVKLPQATLGQCLKAHRIAAKLTQHRLATRLGATQNSISFWEQDRKQPHWRNLVRLSSVLGIELAAIEHLRRRRRTKLRGPSVNQDKHGIVIESAQKGLSMQQISARLGISPQYVRQIMAWHGIAPGVLKCRQCGKELGPGRIGRPNRNTLCVVCLQQQPSTSFGQRLRGYRVAAGLTLKNLAAKCGLNLSSIYAWERDYKRPNPATLAKLIEVLGARLT